MKNLFYIFIFFFISTIFTSCFYIREVKDARKMQKLRELGELHESGALTDEEFQEEKKKYLKK